MWLRMIWATHLSACNCCYYQPCFDKLCEYPGRQKQWKQLIFLLLEWIQLGSHVESRLVRTNVFRKCVYKKTGKKHLKLHYNFFAWVVSTFAVSINLFKMYIKIHCWKHCWYHDSTEEESKSVSTLMCHAQYLTPSLNTELYKMLLLSFAIGAACSDSFL